MRGSQLRKQLIYTVSIHICRMLNGMQNECPIFFSEGGDNFGDSPCIVDCIFEAKGT